jgi:hypothetical protein
MASDKYINELTNHTTPIDADSVPVYDSANSLTKRVLWSSIKATLKTYFDTLYNNYTLTKAAVEAVLTGVISTHSHTVTKSDVGLGNVDNTADTAKPVSTAQQTALDGKISHSLATAVSDFLVSSGAGVFIKKTLAEVKTILGLGSAAYTASSDYATAGHNHSGVYAPVLGADDNYVTDAEKVKLSNLSGTNTGDQTLPVKATGAEINTGTDDTKFATAKAIKNSILFNLPEGVMYNGVITPSVASNNLTVALKTLAGTNPSDTDPVYVRIGGVVRTITSALSLVENAGYAAYNSSSAEFATKEIDYFVYLGWKSSNSTVRIGISRIPYSTVVGDFSGTINNEKYCPLAYNNDLASTDVVVNIGRFAATHSAGAGYTWSVPTFTASNLIQKSINLSKHNDLTYTFGFSGGAGNTAPTFAAVTLKYKVVDNLIFVNGSLVNTSAGTAGAGTGLIYLKTPFVCADAFFIAGQGYYRNGATYAGMLLAIDNANGLFLKSADGATDLTGATFNDADNRRIYFNAIYRI